MEETGKPESQRNETSVFHRALFWLFVVFAIGEAPFAMGELLNSAENRGGRVSRELRSADLPAGYLAPAETLALAESAESDHIRLKSLTDDADDGASGTIPVPSPVARRGLTAVALAVADQNPRNPATGFSSRAPPSLA